MNISNKWFEVRFEGIKEETAWKSGRNKKEKERKKEDSHHTQEATEKESNKWFAVRLEGIEEQEAWESGRRLGQKIKGKRREGKMRPLTLRVLLTTKKVINSLRSDWKVFEEQKTLEG